MYIAIIGKMWQVEWGLLGYWKRCFCLSPRFLGGRGGGCHGHTWEKRSCQAKNVWHFKSLMLGYLTRTNQICYCWDERTGLCSTFPCLSGTESSSSSDCFHICAQSQTLFPDSPDQPGTAVGQRCCADCGLCTSLKGLLPGWPWTAFAPGKFVSHGLSRVPDTLLVKQLLVLFQWVQVECIGVRGQREMYFLKMAMGQFGLSGSMKM